MAMDCWAGSAPQIDAVKVVALYEAESGEIVHVLTVTMFKGGRAVTDEEAIEAAREHAGRLGHAVAQLKTQVSSNIAHAAGPHRINPETGAFVPLPVPDLRRREQDVLRRRPHQP